MTDCRFPYLMSLLRRSSCFLITFSLCERMLVIASVGASQHVFPQGRFASVFAFGLKLLDLWTESVSRYESTIERTSSVLLDEVMAESDLCSNRVLRVVVIK